jgi:hypothetical protein
MLQLEGRELRRQAKRLKAQLAGATSREQENWSGAQDFVEFAGDLRTG